MNLKNILMRFIAGNFELMKTLTKI